MLLFMGHTSPSSPSHYRQPEKEEKKTPTLTFEIPLYFGTITSDKQLEQQLLMLERAVVDCMRVLRNEARTISADMEALALRIEDQGSAAILDDIRTARWYKTAHRFELLKNLYHTSCAIAGRTPLNLKLLDDIDVSDSNQISIGETESAD